ncbi:MAG: pseudouridine synthase [Deferribacteraceae bacterium]|nr:pseudouridine synthase [Deferribacteraceae bacterium]
MSEGIRLSKRVAQTGKYSRHEADKLISQGRVTVNGKIALPGTKTNSEGEVITVDGVTLGEKDFSIYKFHKPRKILSSYSDPNGKANLSGFPALTEKKMGYSGRLDYDSEGLMLFTSDGELIYKLQRSEFHVEKEYLVYTDKEIDNKYIDRISAGIESDGERFLPCKVRRISFNQYSVILIEGKKRQVRRMFKYAGAEVKRLIRTRIGCVYLDGLPEGGLEKITDEEIKELWRCTESK